MKLASPHLRPVIILLTCLIASFRAEASNVSLLSIGGQPKFLSASGDPLPNGAIVRIGYFSNLHEQRPTITTASIPTLEGLLSEIGDRVSAPGSGENSDSNPIAINDPFGSRGDISVQVQNVNVAAQYAPPNYTDGNSTTRPTQWAVIVYNTPDPADATEIGIFTSTEWFVPPNPAEPSTLATSDSIEAIRGAIDGGLRLAPIATLADAEREWREQYFSQADLDDPAKETTLWGRDANPDGDSANNFQEFAFGGNPISTEIDPNVGIEYSYDAGDNKFIASFTRLSGGLLDYKFQISVDLDQWSETATTENSVTPIDSLHEAVLLTDELASKSLLRRFVRVRVTE